MSRQDVKPVEIQRSPNLIKEAQLRQQERPIVQYVLSVERKLEYLLNRILINRYIVVNALQTAKFGHTYYDAIDEKNLIQAVWGFLV